MQNYNQSSTERLNFNVRTFEMIAAFGFIAMIASNFLSFVPIEAKTWREIGVGFPVVLASIVGVALVLKRHFFWSFFIAMFSAFFITHEVIICYDNKAVEMGRELGPDGWFRPVAMIFQDAMNPSYGAFWGICGISLTILAILIGWVFNTYQENQKAALAGSGEEEPVQFFTEYAGFDENSIYAEEADLNDADYEAEAEDEAFEPEEENE